MFQKIEETLALGGTGVLMQGGLHPDLKIDYYEDLLSQHQAALSADSPALLFRAGGFEYRGSLRPTLRDTIVRLMDAGLDSIPGGGAEILDDEVRRRIARLKCTTDEWLLMHRTAH